jgi:hypothetical protein
MCLSLLLAVCALACGHEKTCAFAALQVYDPSMVYLHIGLVALVAHGDGILLYVPQERKLGGVKHWKV